MKTIVKTFCKLFVIWSIGTIFFSLLFGAFVSFTLDGNGNPAIIRWATIVHLALCGFSAFWPLWFPPLFRYFTEEGNELKIVVK